MKFYLRMLWACALAMMVLFGLLPYVSASTQRTEMQKHHEPIKANAAIINYGDMKMDGNFTFIPESK